MSISAAGRSRRFVTKSCRQIAARVDDRPEQAAEAAAGGAIVSRAQKSPTPRGCRWCRAELSPTARADQYFCSRACRQTAWRLRRRRELHDGAERPIRLAYADPPYPGRARKYYPDAGGEVDHPKLITSLTAVYDGWALSTAADALRAILPFCPPEARVCAWVKPIGASTRSYGLHNCWEPLIVVAGRRRRPGVRDWLAAQPARFGGDLMGRKPIAFAAWLFDALGAAPGDTLADLFPGSGVISRAWAELSRRTSEASGDVSRSS